MDPSALCVRCVDTKKNIEFLFFNRKFTSLPVTDLQLVRDVPHLLPTVPGTGSSNHPEIVIDIYGWIFTSPPSCLPCPSATEALQIYFLLVDASIFQLKAGEMGKRSGFKKKKSVCCTYCNSNFRYLEIFIFRNNACG